MERSPILAKPERKSSYYGDCVTFARVKCGQEISKLIGPIVNPCKTWLKTYLFVVRKHYESPTTKLDTTYLVFAPEFMGNRRFRCTSVFQNCLNPILGESKFLVLQHPWLGGEETCLMSCACKKKIPQLPVPQSAQESCIRFENF